MITAADTQALAALKLVAGAKPVRFAVRLVDEDAGRGTLRVVGRWRRSGYDADAIRRIFGEREIIGVLLPGQAISDIPLPTRDKVRSVWGMHIGKHPEQWQDLLAGLPDGN